VSREWAPGDVALVTITEQHGGRSDVAMLRADGCWEFSDGSGGHSSRTDVIANVRPLAVIDPEDREAVDRLVRAWRTPAPPVDDRDVIHAVMYRNGIPGTLCREGWEPRVTTVTDDATCPACRLRIDGNTLGETARLQAALREFADPKPPTCAAALIIRGEHFACADRPGHGGPHGNPEAEAVWGGEE
jgi:hypothetical protein